LVLQVLPARLGRHPEHPLGGVLVAVLQQTFELRASNAVGGQFIVEFFAPGLERVGDVLQEEQAENDVLVLGGIDLAAQGIGRLPENFGTRKVGVATGVPIGGLVLVVYAASWGSEPKSGLLPIWLATQPLRPVAGAW